MDLKIQLGSSLAPKEVICSYDETPRTLLQANGIAYQDGQVTLNGGVLGTAEMDKSLADLNVSDGDFILVNSKQNSGM